MLECLSLVVSIFTFYCGVASNDENTSDEVKVLLSVLLVGVNSALAIVFVMAVYFYADRFVTAKLRSMDGVDVPTLSFARIGLVASLLFAQTASDLSARMQKLLMPLTSCSRRPAKLDCPEKAELRSVVPAQNG